MCSVLYLVRREYGRGEKVQSEQHYRTVSDPCVASVARGGAGTWQGWRWGEAMIRIFDSDDTWVLLLLSL